MRRPSIPPLVAPVVALALALAACSAAPGPDAGPGPDTPAADATAGLAEPEPGVVSVDGGPGTLAAAARASYARDAPGATVSAATSGEARAFDRLCVGEVDVVDTGRPMTPAEYEQCRRRGLGVVQLQVGADATVVAVGTRTDVGADCLTTGQLRDGFGAGSGVATWTDLDDDFADLPFTAGGPPVTDVTTGLLARTVLGSPDPVGPDLRVDYTVLDGDAATRAFLAGFDADVNRARSLPALETRWTDLRARIKSTWASWAAASAELEKALAARPRVPQRVARARDARAAAVATVRRLREQLAPVDRGYQAALGARDRLDGLAGRVGLLRHGYWSASSDRLRALEVALTPGGDDAPDCVLPSTTTVLDGTYPLSRRLLLTVTTRSLERPEVQAFLVHYLRDSARLAAQAHVVPLPDAEVQRQLGWVTDGDAPRSGVVDGRFGRLDGDDGVPDPPTRTPQVEVPVE